MDFDGEKFRNSKCAKFYDEVIKHEDITKFHVFDYTSLNHDGLELFDDFVYKVIYKFCKFHCDFYPELIWQFYANIWINEVDESYNGRVIKSLVNGIEVRTYEKLLKDLFHLTDKGRICDGFEYTRDSGRSSMCVEFRLVVEELLAKFRVQSDVEINTKVLHPNDLGVHKRTFHWALAKSITLKVHRRLLSPKQKQWPCGNYL